MTTATTDITHPAPLGGRARAYWASAHALRGVLEFGIVAILSYAASVPHPTRVLPGWMFFAGTVCVLAGTWAAQSLRRRAWAEVPGALRVHPAVEDADQASWPDQRFDLFARAARAAIWTAGAFVVAGMPGPYAQLLTGLVGGILLASYLAELTQTLLRRRPKPHRVFLLSQLTDLIPAITWAVLGDTQWCVYGILLTIPLVLLGIAVRYLSGRR